MSRVMAPLKAAGSDYYEPRAPQQGSLAALRRPHPARSAAVPAARPVSHSGAYAGSPAVRTHPTYTAQGASNGQFEGAQRPVYWNGRYEQEYRQTTVAAAQQSRPATRQTAHQASQQTTAQHSAQHSAQSGLYQATGASNVYEAQQDLYAQRYAARSTAAAPVAETYANKAYTAAQQRRSYVSQAYWNGSQAPDRSTAGKPVWQAQRHAERTTALAGVSKPVWQPQRLRRIDAVLPPSIRRNQFDQGRALGELAVTSPAPTVSAAPAPAVSTYAPQFERTQQFAAPAQGGRWAQQAGQVKRAAAYATGAPSQAAINEQRGVPKGGLPSVSSLLQ